MNQFILPPIARESSEGLAKQSRPTEPQYADERYAVPLQLVKPFRLLRVAARTNTPVQARLRALATMIESLDSIQVVSALNPSGGKDKPWETNGCGPTPGQGSAPGLARWVEFLYERVATLLSRQLLPELTRQGVSIVPVEQLTVEQLQAMGDYFQHHVYPLLTPLAVDSGHPFPYISHNSLNLLVELDTSEWRSERSLPYYARIKLPQSTPRLLPVPARIESKEQGQVRRPFSSQRDSCRSSRHGKSKRNGEKVFVWSGELVRYFVHQMFPEMRVKRVASFRVLRSRRSQQSQESQAASLNCRQGGRSLKPVVRLDVETGISDTMLQWLVKNLEMPAAGVIAHRCVLELGGLAHLAQEFVAWAEADRLRPRRQRRSPLVETSAW